MSLNLEKDPYTHETRNSLLRYITLMYKRFSDTAAVLTTGFREKVTSALHTHTETPNGSGGKNLIRYMYDAEAHQLAKRQILLSSSHFKSGTPPDETKTISPHTQCLPNWPTLDFVRKFEQNYVAELELFHA